MTTSKTINIYRLCRLFVRVRRFYYVYGQLFNMTYKRLTRAYRRSKWHIVKLYKK